MFIGNELALYLLLEDKEGSMAFRQVARRPLVIDIIIG
jgi:hypothetical protein